MAIAPYYRFTPCCGGHPISLKVTDQFGNIVVFNDLPKVYQYLGAPYADSIGPYYLLTDQCYLVEEVLGDLSVVVNFNDCPAEVNFDESTHETCAEAAEDPKCECPQVYEFVSCCTGISTIYNVTGLSPGDIISGSTYIVALDADDFTTAGCYTISETTVPDPSLLPTIDIFNIDGPAGENGCNEFICFLLCQECRCQNFQNGPTETGIYLGFTCDLVLVSITNGNGIGSEFPILQYTGDPTQYPLTEGICLTYWVEQSPGLIRTDSGLCDIVYWNGEGIEANCPIYYKIVNCLDENEEYCVSNDLSVEYSSNEVLTVNGVTFANKCWRIEETVPCPQTITISFTITDASCADCLDKLTTSYELINCNDGEIIIYTSTDLQDYINSYITLEEYPGDCWFVQLLTSAIPSDITVSVNQEFLNCETCSGPQYLLEDCSTLNPEPDIITNTDLSAYIGQVITLLNCPDTCWIVSETEPIPTPQLVNVTANYVDCEDCLPVPPEPIPPVYKYKSIRPGYNTPGCSPDKFERILCNFSEAMYRQIMVDAYGITPCCGEDDIQYEIRYELIKLKAIQDPDFNCKLTNSCDCTTSAPGLTPCVPIPVPPVVCHIYEVTVQSPFETSFGYIDCLGNKVRQVTIGSKSNVQYTICGVAGQVLIPSTGMIVFFYEETVTNCTT
jgi:hypothetical protein